MLKNITANGFNGNLIRQHLSQFENISCVYYGENYVRSQISTILYSKIIRISHRVIKRLVLETLICKLA
ncbi:hypothetical protein EPI10_020695 [Gossypium australe]|uniref:Uncharacterized protein n=1 Tax=Gossypium australe TaxID=47621 RepID=A0A5B6WG08_9ROSI|nr:hypothetical protein EPI10_020695 [Gossypium australe]